MTAPEIPWRAAYPIDESAQLLGVTPAHLYEMIRNGKRAKYRGNARIDPSFVREIGGRICLKRAYIFDDELPMANVTPFPGQPVDIPTVVRQTVRECLAALSAAAERVERSA